MKKLKVLIAGGGTGGHIYPGLAIADYIKANYENSQVEFVGSRRGLEKDIIPKFNYKLHMLKVGQLHSSVGRLTQLKTLILMPLVMLHALWIVIKFRPKAVIGVGGYASGPLVFMASLLGIRTAIWEANVQPGITNKFLSKFVRYCFVVFPSSLKFFPKLKVKCVGYPVRKQIEDLYFSKKQNPNFMARTSTQPLKVLVFGGSQGAAVFNRVIPEVAKLLPDVKFTLQTGTKNYESFKGQTFAHNLTVLPFLDPIVDFYQKADLIICRSGAGAVTELSAMGLNCLFVPFPRASDDHQRINAQAIVDQNAGDLMLEDEFTVESVKTFLEKYKLKTPDEISQIQKNMQDFFQPGATKQMVDQLLNK